MMGIGVGRLRNSPNMTFVAAWVALITICSGCIGDAEQEVVVYCALDKEFSEPVLKQFQEQTHIKVLPKFDQESNKTVGLANEIIQQRQRQRCDVFWNNEILHSLRLKQLGLLDVYASPRRTDYPDSFVSNGQDWYGFAARARVLIVNRDLLPDPKTWPTSIQDLVNPDWKDNCAIAKPLFGTTATHATVLFQQWGAERAEMFFRKLAANAQIESGNKQVAMNVARGRYAFGLTDTDDAIIEIEQGHPVAIVFPDQGEDGSGTLLIPNTLCIVRGGPNRKQAQQLVDYLLQAKIEDQLARGKSAQIPLNQHASVRSRLEPEQWKIMPVDFEAAAAEWESAKDCLKAIFPL